MELRKLTIGQLLHETADHYPQNDALIFLNETYTYADLLREAQKHAKGMLALGIRKGDHVAIWANDRPRTILCFYALWLIGAVAVPMCTKCTAWELEHYLNESDAAWMCLDAGQAQLDLDWKAALKHIPLSHTFSLEDDLCGTANSWTDLARLGEKISDEMLAEAESAVTWEDTDCLLFTSGSTGASKAVETTHYNRVNTATAQAYVLHASPRDRFCSALPTYHCFSLTATILAAMTVGATVILTSDRRTKTIVQTIQNQFCTIFSAVPTLFSAILARPDLDQYDFSSLRTGIIGGSTYPPELFREICDKMGMYLMSSLGQTESSAGLSASALSDYLTVRSTTVGKFFPGLEGKIADLRTGEAIQGTVGEICVRGYNVMKGYYGHPELTAQTIDAEGWLHTGDLGWIDKVGNIHYAGRKKEMIIRGGENISPLELENLLAQMDGVRTVKVIGIADPHYTEEICACLITDGTVEAEQVREFIRSRLAYYKVPKYVLFFDSFPQRATGKIDTMTLRNMAEFELRQNGQLA